MLTVLFLAAAASSLSASPDPAVRPAVALPDTTPADGGTAAFEPAPARSHRFPLTIRAIMRGPEVLGKEPTDVRWTDDSRWVYFRWLPGGRDWHDDRELYRVPAEGGEPEVLSDEAADTLAPLVADGDRSPDRRLRVSAVRGDLYLVERDRLEVTRLTRTRAEEETPRFSADGHRVFFRRENDLFVLRRDDGAIRQLTDVRSGPSGEEDEEPTGQREFLEEQQEELFEHVRVEEAEEKEQETREERREEAMPEPFHLRSREEVRTLVAEPRGRRALAVLEREPDEARSASVPRWVTESGYTEAVETRPMVGDRQSSFRIVLFDLETGEAEEVAPLSPGDGSGRTDTAEDSPSPPTDSAEEAPPEADSAAARPSDPPTDRPDLATVRFFGWTDSGSHGLLAAVDFDYGAWRLYSVEATSGELTELVSHRDSAWVNGPCFLECVGWIPGAERAYFVSEATGWAHLHTVEADGSDLRQLTRGAWEVHSARVPEGRERFLLQTTEESPFDLHAYWMARDGSERTRITDGSGRFEVTPSPDGRRLAVLHSRSDRPPELYLADSGRESDGGRDGGGGGGEVTRGAGLVPNRMERITVSPTEPWRDFPWTRPEIVRFEARDGTPVPARIYRPSDLGAEPNGAGVVFVHGAGYLHNVHHWWSSYEREYMFHHLLAARGYTVLDVDYRGSAGYGRDWRTAVYRHMGGKDLTDQVDGVRYLVGEEGVDPDRVGIYGGSYGGFITLMALFTTEDVFRAGAALRSVTDWAHYNHWYTSRILNLPHRDEEAYRRSSPLYRAEGLDPDEHLLILHGMEDRNVLFSDVVRLTQRLVELGKENWEMAVYPVEGHAFEAPTSWTDEYRRIYELFEETIGGSGDD